ncbi:prepilin-type N-terminal cleavage/methylation domain-containing protein [Meiothermus sp. QL-1]|uniref:prepilin-type N-terminal cleavage/methylation domain-containing protein n=1 Tax=Meiothermus sp. QL-1 TaxID=2058095 RepID=UPI000E0BC54D|nr:prepilin-type N-terminal cleavage/methylation domain-containing protein [Meiothermus sp. QL-1]RDI95150.1 prepilin-type N-terminal cleavage/methylation domain-containing protein [Meiothermus sp. QL-1]
MSREGLSLLELLVVLAVLGILLGVGFVSLRAYRESLVLREAATQVATELMNIRQQARRQSANFTFQAAQGGSTYRVGQTSRLATLPPRSLPAGVVFQAVPQGGSVTFYAPYGLVSAANSTYALKGPGGRVLQVNIVGSTGKVVVRAP